MIGATSLCLHACVLKHYPAVQGSGHGMWITDVSSCYEPCPSASILMNYDVSKAPTLVDPLGLTH
jgi:hypothetical protein